MARLLAVAAERLCKEYLMGSRRAGASRREALQVDLAKGAPMLRRRLKGPGRCESELTTQKEDVHDTAAGPLALPGKHRSE